MDKSADLTYKYGPSGYFFGGEVSQRAGSRKQTASPPIFAWTNYTKINVNVFHVNERTSKDQHL